MKKAPGHYFWDKVMADGRTLRTCRVCEFSYITTEEAKYECEHEYEKTILAQESCTIEGTISYVCSICEDCYTEIIPALGHDYVETIVPPTTTAGGYTEYVCSRCGDSYQDNFVDPLPSGKEDMVRAFVERMYTIVLGRAAEEQGLNDWTKRLMNKEIDGAALVDMFVNSDEFLARNTSNEEYVKILYRAVLGREADESGLKMWTDMLADDWTRDYILDGLVLSAEFKSICDSYGIIAAFEPTPESQVRSFVKRMYTVVLNRRADAVGLEEWTVRLLNGTANGAQVSDGFISSDEFVNRNLNDEKYVKVLYRAFFNREADAEGYAVWMGELAKGVSRRDVMKGFVHSVEFSDLCAAYGIIRGEME
jgi:hypothetical protein